VALWEPEELACLTDAQMLVDVRTFQENALGTIPGAVCAPVDELRDRLEDLPRDKELLVFCQVVCAATSPRACWPSTDSRYAPFRGLPPFGLWKGTSPGAGMRTCHVPEDAK